MRTLLTLAPLAIFAASGCQLATVEPEPLSGPMPSSIGIWPAVVETAGSQAPELLEGLDRAVRNRGYRGPSFEVGRRMLFDASPTAAPPTLDDLAGIGRLLEVDAILVLEVIRFAADGERLRSASWHLQWRLLSTNGHGELWSYEHHGSWTPRAPFDDDPLRRLDAEPEVVPIGGDRTPHFRSVPELVAELHRLAMEHLPRHSR